MSVTAISLVGQGLNHGFATFMVFHIRLIKSGFSAILLINDLSLFWPTADFLNQGLEDSCLVQLFTAR